MIKLVNSRAYKTFLGPVVRAGLLLCCCMPSLVAADTVNVAVASNFATTMEIVKHRFQEQSGHRVNLIKGSSGKHYAQIIHGAPFDLFLSADAERPRQLERQGLIIDQSRRVYALGQLVLWSRYQNLRPSRQSLANAAGFNYLALANPALAPYGRAAIETLKYLALLPDLENKMVMGENVAQAFQFAYSGNAEFGLVALSQALTVVEFGSYWLVPAAFYSPIRQEMVLLTDASAARGLFEFLGSDAMQSILETSGYLWPELSQ